MVGKPSCTVLIIFLVDFFIILRPGADHGDNVSIYQRPLAPSNLRGGVKLLWSPLVFQVLRTGGGRCIFFINSTFGSIRRQLGQQRQLRLAHGKGCHRCQEMKTT